MNCREAQNQILAERDGALAETERAALMSHLEHCGDCRRVRVDFTQTLSLWKTQAQAATVPDVEREWHAVRRKIRGGVEAGEVRLTPRRPSWVTWLTVPLAAIGAAALALLISLPSANDGGPNSAAARTPHVARAESVRAPGQNASTMIYVDDKSGWLIVLASDANPKQG